MATLTATGAAASAIPVLNHTGDTTVTFTCNTSVEASAQTILMGKIPDQVVVTDVSFYASCGADTIDMIVGSTGDLSRFAGSSTKGTVARTSKGDGLNYTISLSDSAANQFVYATVTPTAGTATTSFKATMVITYHRRHPHE